MQELEAATPTARRLRGSALTAVTEEEARPSTSPRDRRLDTSGHFHGRFAAAAGASSPSSSTAAADDAPSSPKILDWLVDDATWEADAEWDLGGDPDALPPLSSMGDYLEQQLRVSRLPPSAHAREAERAVLDAAAEEWGMDRAAFAPYNRVGVWFSSFVFPSATTPARLAAVCTHQSLFALLDDLCFDAAGIDPAPFGLPPAVTARGSPAVAALFRGIDAAFRSAGTSPTPGLPRTVARAAADAGARLRALGGPAWHAHCADAVDDFVQSCIALQADMEGEGDTDRAGTPPPPRASVRDLRAYARMRCRNSAVLHVCHLMEVACDAVLPNEARAHPTVRGLTALCVRMVALVNDVFSYHKDVVHEGSAFNVLKVLMDVEGVPFPRAVRRAVGIVRASAREFAALEAALGAARWEWPAAAAAAARYVRCLRECVVGNYHFHNGINRYRSPDSPFPELSTFL